MLLLCEYRYDLCFFYVCFCELQADEDEVEENMRDEVPYEMETDFGVNDLPYLRVPIFRVSTPFLRLSLE